jgi:O-antigen ligase
VRMAAVTGRTWRTFVLVLLGLGLATLLAADAAVACLRGTSAAAKPPSVPLAVDKSLGINADLSQLEAGEREQALAAMEAAGFHWIRQRFPWDAIEQEQGVYDWAAWDAIVSDVTRHNLRPIAVLDGSPAWARAEEDAGNALAPPVENRDFGDWATALALRYGDQIDYYQIWDEPNIAPHWGERQIDPAAYVRLLREGAIRVRAADPGAVILTAALAPNVEPGGANMSDLLFLDALYQQGAADWFDVVASQPYDFDQPSATPADPGELNWNRISLLRAVMDERGDGETAVWAVSFGTGARDPETARDLVEQARGNWPWLGPMLWAAWLPGDLHGDYALIDLAGNREPVLGTLQTLATAPVVAWPGVYPADHPSGRYEGGWRVTATAADIGGSGDRLTIAFRGTRLDLTVRRGDYRAFLYVAVDGQPANGLPRDDEGRAYVVLYDPAQETATVNLAHGLPDGEEHVAEIVADRGWGQWAIAGWTVSKEGKASVPWLPALLGLASFAVMGTTITVGWPRLFELGAAFELLSRRFRALDYRLVLLLTGAAAILFDAVTGTIPSLATLVLLAALLLLRPETGLPLIALALPFYQLGKPLLGKMFSMVEILTLLTAVGWLVNRAVGFLRSRSEDTDQLADGKRLPVRLSPLDWGVVALVLVGALSLLWAEHGREAAREFRTVVLEAGIFYGLLRLMVGDRRAIWRVADGWVLGAAAIALVGVYQWAFGQNLITADGVWRVRGFYGSPNNLALYLGRAFPVGIAIGALSVTSLGERGGEALGSRRWVYGLAAVAMAAALFLTYSRGAWLLGVPASLLFLAAMGGRRIFAVTVGILIVVALAAVFLIGAGRLTSLLNTTEGTTFFRLQLWQSSWAMIRDHPLLGVGLDNFLYYYRSAYVLPTAWQEFNLSHPHDLILDFWLRLGLAGLVIAAWLLVAFFRRGWRAVRRLRLADKEERLLVVGLMAGMVDFVAHGLVDNAFFLVDLAFVFMLMLALVQRTEAR